MSEFVQALRPDVVVVGPFEFVWDDAHKEMYVNRLADADNPTGDADHIGTADPVFEEDWLAFVGATVR